MVFLSSNYFILFYFFMSPRKLFRAINVYLENRIRFFRDLGSNVEMVGGVG